MKTNLMLWVELFASRWRELGVGLLLPYRMLSVHIISSFDVSLNRYEAELRSSMQMEMLEGSRRIGKSHILLRKLKLAES